MDSAKTIVFVHGGFHGAWSWEHVAAQLDAHGIAHRAINLLSCGMDAAALGDLQGDVNLVREEIANIDGAVIVCGHSYGGAVITAAAAGQKNVQHLVYLAASIPDVGESHADCLVREGWQFSWPNDGILRWRAGEIAEHFYNDCSEASVSWAVSRLAPFHSALSLVQPVEAAAWRQVDSTYVICNDDRAIPRDVQCRLASRTRHVLELSSGHSPFLSCPEAVADLLENVAFGSLSKQSTGETR